MRYEEFQKLPLNALGDFLAGTFAPLALLWLVIGYFQQGDELRQNSRALLLQAEELRQAAEHAGGLLDVAKREHDLAIEKLRAEQRQREEQQRKREADAEQRKEFEERRRKKGLQPVLSFYMAFIENGVARLQLNNRGKGCTDFSIEIPANSVLELLDPVEIESLNPHASIFLHLRALKRLGTTPVIARWTDADGDRHELEFTASVADKTININD